MTLIVPYPAGGPSDTLARVLAEAMRGPLGQTVIIENVSGAGGSIGTGRVARSAPDGYTLSLGHVQTHVLNGATQNLNYDVVKDFEPVTLIADTPTWIVARATFPAKDLKEMVAWMKANPGKATVGAVGVGGPADIAAIYFQRHTGTTFQIVPYGRRAADPGPDRRADRPDLRPGGELSRPGARRPAQGLCRARRQALVGVAGDADHRRGGRARSQLVVLARPLGAQGHAEGRRSPSSTPRCRRRSTTRP